VNAVHRGFAVVGQQVDEKRQGETYGGRNTKAKQAQDAADLRAAVDNNFDAIKRGLLEEGLSESDIEAAREQLHRLSKEQGWY
jgi:hypothetical protein